MLFPSPIDATPMMMTPRAQALRSIDERGQRLQRAGKLALERGNEKLAAAAQQLHALSPLNVLTRGYSLTRRGDGTLLRASADVAAGEIIETRLHAGTILSRVLGPSSPPTDSTHVP